MIGIKAKIGYIKRVRINPSASITPIYDDNVLCISQIITEGPQSIIDRTMTTTIGISEFVDRLPAEVAIRLRNELNERIPS